MAAMLEGRNNTFSLLWEIKQQQLFSWKFCPPTWLPRKLYKEWVSSEMTG